MKNPRLPLSKKGFTLIEILIVVIIVGLLTGLAIVKINDTRDRAETNYLKTMVNFIDSKIEIVIAQEGTFPTINAATPEERLTEILGILDSRNLFVTAEEIAMRNYLANQAASVTSLLEVNTKARNNLPTGAPRAKEILVLPVDGPIVYPERLSLVVNDPNNPNYTFHYKDFWLPQEVASAVSSLMGGTLTEKEKNLIFNNVAMTGLDTATLKDLLLHPTNSAEFNSAANQVAELAGNSEDYLELLQHMLFNGNYDPSAVDLSKIDLTRLDALTLNKLLDNTHLTANQIGYLSEQLLEKGDLGAWNRLLKNPGMDSTKLETLLATLTPENAADFFAPAPGYGSWFLDLNGVSGDNVGKTMTHLANTVGAAFTGTDLIAKQAELLSTLNNYSGVSTPLEFADAVAGLGNDKINALLSGAMETYNWDIGNIVKTGLVTLTDANKNTAISKIGAGHHNAMSLISAAVDQLSPDQLLATKNAVLNIPYYALSSAASLLANPNVFPNAREALDKALSVANTGIPTLVFGELLKNPNFNESDALYMVNAFNNMPNNNMNKTTYAGYALRALSELELTPAIENAIVGFITNPNNTQTNGSFVSGFPNLSDTGKAALWNYALNATPDTNASYGIRQGLTLDRATLDAVITGGYADGVKRDLLNRYTNDPATPLADVEALVSTLPVSVIGSALSVLQYSSVPPSVVDAYYTRLMSEGQTLTSDQLNAVINKGSALSSGLVISEALDNPAGSIAVLNAAIQNQKLDAAGLTKVLNAVQQGTVAVGWDSGQLSPYLDPSNMTEANREQIISLAPANPAFYGMIGGNLEMLNTYLKQPGADLSKVSTDWTFGYIDYSKPQNIAAAGTAAAGLASNVDKALGMVYGFEDAVWNIPSSSMGALGAGLGTITTSLLKANPSLGSNPAFVNAYKSIVTRVGVGNINVSYEDIQLLRTYGIL